MKIDKQNVDVLGPLLEPTPFLWLFQSTELCRGP
jgi:hypothetical protein